MRTSRLSLAPVSLLLVTLATLAGCAARTDDDDGAAPSIIEDTTTPAALGPPGPGPLDPCVRPTFPPLGPQAGNIDTFFGCQGVASFTSAAEEVQVRALAIQADDAILVAGETYDAAMNNHDVWVARYTPGGKLDATFGTGGVFRYDITAPLGGAESAEAIVVQPNGAIVVGGGFWREDNSERKGFLLRLSPSGALDPSFGDGGLSLLSSITIVRAVKLQDDGAIAAVGEQCTGGAATCVAAMGRFAANDGAVLGGSTTLLGGASPARGNAAAVIGNTVLVGGTTATNGGSDAGFARYANGLDNAFGVGGVKKFDSVTSEAVRGLAPYGGGYVSVESATTSGGVEQFVVRRIGSNGTPTASFGVGGRVVDAFAGYGAQGAAVATAAGSKIIAAGSAKNSAGKNRIAVARLTSLGALDTTFSTDGNVMLTAGGTEAVATTIGIQSGGGIVVGGWAKNDAGKKRAVLVRLYD